MGNPALIVKTFKVTRDRYEYYRRCFGWRGVATFTDLVLLGLRMAATECERETGRKLDVPGDGFKNLLQLPFEEPIPPPPATAPPGPAACTQCGQLARRPDAQGRCVACHVNGTGVPVVIPASQLPAPPPKQKRQPAKPKAAARSVGNTGKAKPKGRKAQKGK